MGDRLRIVALGDSTTAGTPGFRSALESPPSGRGDPESQYAFWIEKAQPGWEVLNRGVNGERSDEVRARFARDVIAAHPAYVIILAGVNDVYQGRLPHDVERNLAPMYAEALDADIVPLAASILTYDTATDRDTGAIREVNRWLKTTAATLGIPYCDTAAAVAHPRDPAKLRASPDGLHPDVDGYRRMGEALAAALVGDLRWRGRA